MSIQHKCISIGLILGCLTIAHTSHAQVPTEKPTDVSIKGNIYKLLKMKPTDETISKLTVPEGFKNLSTGPSD